MPVTVKEGEALTSPCFTPDFQSEWKHAKIAYKIKGQKAGRVHLSFFPCRKIAIADFNLFLVIFANGSVRVFIETVETVLMFTSFFSYLEPELSICAIFSFMQPQNVL